MREGDFVCVRFIGYYYYGYIQQIYPGSGVFSMRILRKHSGSGVEYFKAEYRKFGISQAELAEYNGEPDDFSDLIDLALMTGDAEWFHELTEKRMNKQAQPIGHIDYQPSQRAIRNTLITLSDALRPIVERITEAFDFIKKAMEKAQLFAEEEEKPVNKKECRSGWYIQKDTRKESQVLLNKPRFIRYNLI